VQVSCIDLQGADLSRRLLHRSTTKTELGQSGFSGNNVLTIYRCPTLRPAQGRLSRRLCEKWEIGDSLLRVRPLSRLLT
jgi:hypothetical protein